MNHQSGQNRIRLVLVDDVGLYRASLSRLLSSEPGLEVAAECSTFLEALAILKNPAVDVVLFDLTPDLDAGNEFMVSAKQEGYTGHFLILTTILDGPKSAKALRVGASGIFIKSEPPERLVQAIKLVATGEVWVDPRVIHLLADHAANSTPELESLHVGGPLPDRERKVLNGIVSGLSNRQIGNQMGISESSVKNIVQRLFGKAGVKTRSQLVRVAMESPLASEEQFAAANARP
jgi:DNA-binding NarL/FixJ family response regulator